jgi:translation initiation factor 2 beta subunit (eIF-2beta)/eIF-5
MKKEIILEDVPGPCRKCGSSRVIKIGDAWGRIYLIKCKRCGKKGPKAEKLQEAIRLWNKMTE